MNKKLLVVGFAILLAFTSHGAVGDLVGASIHTNGMSVRLQFEGMPTNGVVEHGMGTNRAEVENAKLAINLVRQARTDDNSATTIPATIYGTKALRIPATSFIASSQNGTNVFVDVALSRFIFGGDSNLTMNIGSGLYIAGGITNTAASSVSVTNNSVLLYQPPVGNWFLPDHQLLTNTSFTLKAFAMHPSARGGRPVRSMIFTLSDGTTTLTNTQTEAKVDHAAKDQAVVCEFMADFVITNLLSGVVYTADFIAVPWEGTNVLNTADGVNPSTSTRYRTARFVGDWKRATDPTNSYGMSVARVSTNGVSATAKVQRYHEWLLSPTTNFYANTKDAYQAIVASNNTAGWLPSTRNDAGGAVILHMPGHYAMSGNSTVPSGTIPSAFVVITADPSTDRTNVIFDGTSSNVRFRARTKWDNVTIAKTNTATAFSTEDHLWFNECILDQSAANWASSCTNVTVTYCYITNYPSMTPTGGPQTIGLFRGNRMDRWVGTITPTVVIGNVWYLTNSVAAMHIDNDRTGTNEDCTNSVIYAFNRMYGVNQGVSHGMNLFANADNDITGSLVVQNAIESTHDGVFCVFNMGNSTSGNFRNIGQAYNSFLGKYIACYNDNTSNAPFYELNWRAKNVTLNDNLKSDLFTVSNAARTNNWSCYWGVEDTGNWYVETEPVGAAGSFPHESPGMQSYQFQSPTTNAILSFVSANFFSGVTSGGNTPGVYRFNPQSMVWKVSGGRPGFFGLPVDLAGQPRSPYDPPGAYVGGNLKQAQGFAK